MTLPAVSSFARRLAFLLLLAPAAALAAITTVDPWHTAGNGNITDFGGHGTMCPMWNCGINRARLLVAGR